MPIRIICPSCNVANAVDDDKRGRRIRCRKCDNPISVPETRIKTKSKSAAAIQSTGRLKKVPVISGTVLYLIIGGVAAGLMMCLSGVGIGAYLMFRGTPTDDKVAKADNTKGHGKNPHDTKTEDVNKKEDKKNPKDVPRADPKIPEDRKSPVFGGVAGSAFVDVAPEGSILVGFEVGLEKLKFSKTEEDLTRSLRPIYRNAKGEETNGPDQGSEFKRTVTMKAKPGYAIGALVIQAGHGLDGLQATYMRLNGDSLDPKDSYESECVGRKTTDPNTAGGNGVPMVGIIGKKTPEHCTGLGVVFKSPVTAKIIPDDRKSRVLGGVGNGTSFEDVAPDGSILVGLEVGLKKLGPEWLTQSVRPIYRYATGEEIKGPQRGKRVFEETATEKTVTVRAKPGYAIGALVIQSGHGIDGVQAVFMRVNGSVLDPTDRYLSDSVGRPGISPNKLNGGGVPIVGIIGMTAGNRCSGFGVVYNGASKGDVSYLSIPSFGGGAMTLDNKTLIVALTSAGMLGYYDSLSAKEIKKVDVDFQPNVLAIQGKHLFVGVKGSAIIHVLEADSAKKVKTIKIPGDPLQEMTVHPGKGPLYASNSAGEVFVVDPVAGSYKKTNARGKAIVIDPSNGKYLYVGTLNQGRCAFTKYEAENGEILKVIGTQDNAVIRGFGIALRSDGKAVGMFGYVGWEPLGGGKSPGITAIFDASDMKTMIGRIDFGSNRYITFHPTLKLGAAWRSSGEIAFFDSQSFAVKELAKVNEDDRTAAWMTFGGQGTRLIISTGSHLIFVPLELSAEDAQALKKIHL
jgi:hypothetical protein